MDNFINLAKQGYEAYQEHNSQSSVTGGQEYNSPHHSTGSGHDRPQFDHEEVVRTASEHGSGDSSLFSSAMGYVNNNKHEHTQPVDEEGVQNAHRAAYHEGGAGNLSADAMGGAAALQVLQKFTSGGGGGSQGQLISMAMAEATKLFDQSGGAASGSKQDAVNGAAMMVMKLVVQSKFSSLTGGSSSGGMGGLLSLASKFI